MFSQILALGLKESITDIDERIRDFSKEKPIIAPEIKTLELSPEERNHIDAILVSIYTDLTEQDLQSFKNLKYICILGTSKKRIAVDYCDKNNIQIDNISAYCDDETAEWVVLELLKFLREQKNPRSAYGRKLGIIGFGHVGEKLKSRADALGMSVLVNSLAPESPSKQRIFSECELISLHTPAHLCWLTREYLDLLGEHALIVNTCMGLIAEPPVLHDFLKKRPDVTLIMDAVAGASFADMRNVALIRPQRAYETLDSTKRLETKFLDSVKSASTRAGGS